MNERRYLALLCIFLVQHQECVALIPSQQRHGNPISASVTINNNNNPYSSPLMAQCSKGNRIRMINNRFRNTQRPTNLIVLHSTEDSSSLPNNEEDPSLSSSSSSSSSSQIDDETPISNGVNGYATNNDMISEVVDGTPVLKGLGRSSSLEVEVDTDNDDDDKIIPASAAVGAVTATLGFLYVRTLGKTHAVLWNKLPSMLLSKFGAVNPYLFLPGIMTMGGLIIAAIASNLKTPTFAVYDFVSGFSSKTKVEKLPPSRIHLLPLMGLCLLTSSFGFSLGPEAPMVCAGGLTGASLARIIFGKEDEETAHRHQETLAYAGAAGAITASLGVPVAGSIFALEMTRACAGMSKAERVLSPAIIASVAAMMLVRAVYIPDALVGGHFDYGFIGALSGVTMIATAAAAGIGGGVLGTGFHKFVSFLKNRFWAGTSPEKHNMWKRQVLVKGGIGLLVGLLAAKYPQTLFWGEGSLQMMIDGQQTAFEATKHGLMAPLTSAAVVNPSIPYANGFAALQIGLVKLVSIALACAGKFPGGIIFPLFAAAPPFAHVFASFVGPGVVPVAVMSLMASLQASVTRTPLATALILSLTASAGTELSVMLPACLISSYLGVYVARKLSRSSYFTYNN